MKKRIDEVCDTVTIGINSSDMAFTDAMEITGDEFDSYINRPPGISLMVQIFASEVQDFKLKIEELEQSTEALKFAK